jgi:hypothetical protein
VKLQDRQHGLFFVGLDRLFLGYVKCPSVATYAQQAKWLTSRHTQTRSEMVSIDLGNKRENEHTGEFSLHMDQITDKLGASLPLAVVERKS